MEQVSVLAKPIPQTYSNIDLMIAGIAMKYLCSETSYLKGIKLSPQQLFDRLCKFNNCVNGFNNTLTIERIIDICEYLYMGIIVKYTNGDTIVGYAFNDEHLNYLVSTKD